MIAQMLLLIVVVLYSSSRQVLQCTQENYKLRVYLAEVVLSVF
jgi:hypothetical protein